MRKTLNEIQALRKIQYEQSLKKAEEETRENERKDKEVKEKLMDILRQKLYKNSKLTFGQCVLSMFPGMSSTEIEKETNLEIYRRLEKNG